MSKRYPEASSLGPDYDYWPSGGLKTRTWARTLPNSSTRLATSYAYNTAGDLDTVSYNDSTPGTTYTYDRRGRQKIVARNSITTNLAYNDRRSEGSARSLVRFGTGLFIRWQRLRFQRAIC